MKFLYKIHSGYDGFTPRRIPERLADKTLSLGWERYIEDVQKSDDVWVYFHGPHQFENGVYIKGIVKEVDLSCKKVIIRVTQFATDHPLTDKETSKRVADLVGIWFRQVFLFPDHWDVHPGCEMHTTGGCAKRRCETCPHWQSLHRIQHRLAPRQLPSVAVFAPAYWVEPTRCFLHGKLKPEIQRTSEMFYRFKVGEKGLAFPLALGISEELKRLDQVDFDCLVPIPLSPDKLAAKEHHRTKLLAQELSRLLDVPVVEAISLTKPVSKRKMLSQGKTRTEFEREYLNALAVLPTVNNYHRILLVDDVCTRGSTFKCAHTVIRRNGGGSQKIGAACAGLMIVTETVQDHGEVRQAAAPTA